MRGGSPLPPHGPTAKVLRALAMRPHTGPELQDVLDGVSIDVSHIMYAQIQQGNVTRIDGRVGKGYIATYALTEVGKQKIGA